MRTGSGRYFSRRFRFYCMHKVWELDAILNKENRCIVAHHVIVTFLRIKLNRKTANIPYRIGRTTRSLHSRETHENWRFYIWIGQESRFGIFFISCIGLKIAMCTNTARMHNPLWNTFMVEMGDFFS